MAELIYREALKEALLERGFYPAIVKGVLESAHAVDAVPVVICRNCKHWKPSGGAKMDGEQDA